MGPTGYIWEMNFWVAYVSGRPSLSQACPETASVEDRMKLAIAGARCWVGKNRLGSDERYAKKNTCGINICGGLLLNNVKRVFFKSTVNIPIVSNLYCHCIVRLTNCFKVFELPDEHCCNEVLGEDASATEEELKGEMCVWSLDWSSIRLISVLVYQDPASATFHKRHVWNTMIIIVVFFLQKWFFVQGIWHQLDNRN